MGEDDKKNRKFQYALTKAKVDFQFWFAFAIGMLAIGYALLSYLKDNLFGSIAACGVILLAAYFLMSLQS